MARVALGLFRATIVSLWVVPLGAHIVHACEAYQPMTQETVDAARTIFRGKISDYEIVRSNWVKLRFVVTETYRGLRQDEWTLLWINSTYGVPEDLETFRGANGDEMVVGVTTNRLLELQQWSGQSFGEISTLPMVMQQPCGPPVMLKWNGGAASNALVHWGIVPPPRGK